MNYLEKINKLIEKNNKKYLQAIQDKDFELADRYAEYINELLETKEDLLYVLNKIHELEETEEPKESEEIHAAI